MKYSWVTQGAANYYTILKRSGWFAGVQLNGEISVPQQKAIMDDLVSALNGPQSGEPSYNLPLYP